MTIISTKKPTRLGKLAAGIAVAIVLAVSFASAAMAAPRDDHDWRDHESRARNWHRVHRVYTPDVYAPPVIVTPPPAYYPPQPVYAAPAEPSLNFILPLHIH